MIFEPAKYKYRRSFKGRLSGVSNNANDFTYGSFGLKSLCHYRLNSKQLESIRRILTKFVKKKGKVWFNVFPSVPVSKKPADVRMGKGKGSLEYWVCRIKPGRMIFELDGISEPEAYFIMKAASYKMPFACVMLKNKIGGIKN